MFITMFVKDRHVSLCNLLFTSRPTVDVILAEILTASVNKKKKTPEHLSLRAYFECLWAVEKNNTSDERSV